MYIRVFRREPYSVKSGNFYRPQRSCGQGNIFTHVCHSVHRGGAIPACIACGIPACLAAGFRGCVLSQHALQVVSQHALQQVSRGVPGLGGACSGGVAFWFGSLLIEDDLLVESGLLFWPSGVIFCYGLLVWPSGKAF